MVYELTLACGWQADRLSAEAIYVGLATDTGFFRFNSTTARGHQIAAALLGLGVSPSRAFREIYERNSLAYTRLLGHALTGVRMDPGGELAWVTIDRELVHRLDAHDVDTSEMMNVLLALDGVQIVALFRELETGKIKVSLRSKADHDVHALATEFGGGGHKNASGIVLDGGLDDVAGRVTARARTRLGSSAS
jgi:phosphoesterase RecJ-like protein